MTDFSQIVPYLTGGEEVFKVCRPTAGIRIFSFVQFNEFRDRLLNPLDGIVDAAPEPASIKWTLLDRTCDQENAIPKVSKHEGIIAEADQLIDNFSADVHGRLAVRHVLYVMKSRSL